MAKKLALRGRNTVLPLVGDTMVEVCISTCRLPVLVFKAADGGESELTIEDRITLSQGGNERVLDGSKPGTTFNPRELSPLLDLLGIEAIDAIATVNGQLRVEFSNNLVLSILSTTGYEAWHFKYPRPGRPVGDNLRQIVALTGAYGHLI
jgi:hypothetical protein